jgi:hypothetical protein
MMVLLAIGFRQVILEKIRWSTVRRPSGPDRAAADP